MGSVVVQMSESLDGFMAGPDGELDWHLVDDELHRRVNHESRDAAAFFEGRVEHELMEGYWPTAGDGRVAAAPVREFAGIWRDTPRLVLSRTLDRASGRTPSRRGWRRRRGRCSSAGRRWRPRSPSRAPLGDGVVLLRHGRR